MADKIKSIVRFVGIAPGASVSLPHGLHWSPPGGGDLPQIPDLVFVPLPGWTVTADDTDVTVTNNQGVAASVDIYVLLWHTLERAFGDVAILELSPRPLIINPGSSGGVGSDITYLPDVWAMMEVAAGLADVVVSSEASQLFDAVPVNRPMSILGLRTKLTTPVTAGTLTVKVSVNGVPTLASVVHTSVLNPSGGGSQFLPVQFPLVPGDEVGVMLTTSMDFLPDGDVDLAAWVEVGAA